MIVLPGEIAVPQITAQVAPIAHKGQPPKFSPPKSESPIIPNPWKAFRSQKPEIESHPAKRHRRMRFDRNNRKSILTLRSGQTL